MEIVWQPAAGGGVAMAVALVAIAAVWVTGKLMRRGRGNNLPPGPRALPVVGSVLELLNGELPHIAMARLSQKYGPIMFLKLGAAPFVVVSDATLAKACFTGPNDKIFVSRPPMAVSNHLTYNKSTGITLAPYGAEWRLARKLCSLQLFTAKRVTEFQSIRSSEITALVRKIDTQAGQPLNLTRTLASLVEATFCKILLGKPLAEISDAKLGMDLALLVHRMIKLFAVPMVGDFIPAFSFFDRSLKAKLDEIHTHFDILVSGLIRERERRPPGSPQVIMDILLENIELHHAKTITLELIVAGIDSSSTILDWAMAELVNNPQTMRRLQLELDQVAKGERRMIREEELGSLVYLKAVLKETMRLHAPGPLLVPHMSINKCEVGGYKIPKETRLLLNVWAIGRDPKIWEEPNRFMPERFLTEKGASIDFRGQDFELLPFGVGRRICPGLPLAAPVLHSTIANIVHNFDWVLPPGQDVTLKETFGIIVSREEPLMVIPQICHKA